MDFDLHIHIPEDSEIGRAIASLASEKNVTPEEAAEALIDEAVRSRQRGTPTETLPGRKLFGLFADDSELVDEIAREAMALRECETVRSPVD